MEPKFGDVVEITSIVRFEYNHDGYKQLERYTCNKKAVILRKTRRATGNYVSQCYDYGGNYLNIDQWHIVYEVATEPRGSICFIEPDTFKIINDRVLED